MSAYCTETRKYEYIYQIHICKNTKFLPTRRPRVYERYLILCGTRPTVRQRQTRTEHTDIRISSENWLFQQRRRYYMLRPLTLGTLLTTGRKLKYYRILHWFCNKPHRGIIILNGQSSWVGLAWGIRILWECAKAGQVQEVRSRTCIQSTDGRVCVFVCLRDCGAQHMHISKDRNLIIAYECEGP